MHLVLPGSVADFIAASVRPFGAEWVARFERVAADAASVETVAEALQENDILRWLRIGRNGQIARQLQRLAGLQGPIGL